MTKNENTVESYKSVKLCTVFCCNFTVTVASNHVIIIFLQCGFAVSHSQ